MTVKEMERAVDAKCDTYPLCNNCPLWECQYNGSKIDCSRINDEDCTEEEAKEIYELMFPQGGKVELNHDPVSHPSHYTQGGIECIQAMEAAYGKETTAHFCICNAFKYLWRTEHKNGMEDIDKAIWYLTKYKELKFNERTEAV